MPPAAAGEGTASVSRLIFFSGKNVTEPGIVIRREISLTIILFPPLGDPRIRHTGLGTHFLLVFIYVAVDPLSRGELCPAEFEGFVLAELVLTGHIRRSSDEFFEVLGPFMAFEDLVR